MGKYNLTEKKEKNAAYRSLVRAELVDELYEKILKVSWSLSSTMIFSAALSLSTSSKTRSMS